MKLILNFIGHFNITGFSETDNYADFSFVGFAAADTEISESIERKRNFFMMGDMFILRNFLLQNEVVHLTVQVYDFIDYLGNFVSHGFCACGE